MTDKYITAHPLPTPHEREILTILIEECGELIQAATKILRFGAGDTAPGSDCDNVRSMGREAADVLVMIDMMHDAGLVFGSDILHGKADKRAKLAQFMQTSGDTQ
jgi:hypothetical protein